MRSSTEVRYSKVAVWKKMLHWETCEVGKVEETYCEEEKEKRNSQGKDPPQKEKPGRGPKNLSRASGKMASSEEVEGKEVEK